MGSLVGVDSMGPWWSGVARRLGGRLRYSCDPAHRDQRQAWGSPHPRGGWWLLFFNMWLGFQVLVVACGVFDLVAVA